MRGLTVALALLGVSACATPTPYQPSRDQGGYGFTERRIENNRVLVTFRGNSLTERETVETYLLFRAAELTLESGFDHFIVADRETDERTRFTSVGRPHHPGFYPSYWYFAPRWGWRPWYDPFWDDPIDLRQITRYEASAEIAMFRGRKPADNPQAFDAREVIANLGPAVTRPQTR